MLLAVNEFSYTDKIELKADKCYYFALIVHCNNVKCLILQNCNLKPTQILLKMKDIDLKNQWSNQPKSEGPEVSRS